MKFPSARRQGQNNDCCQGQDSQAAEKELRGHLHILSNVRFRVSTARLAKGSDKIYGNTAMLSKRRILGKVSQIGV